MYFTSRSRLTQPPHSNTTTNHRTYIQQPSCTSSSCRRLYFLPKHTKRYRRTRSNYLRGSYPSSYNSIPQQYLQLMSHPHAYTTHIETIAAEAIFNISVHIVYGYIGGVPPPLPLPNTCHVLFYPGHYRTLQWQPIQKSASVFILHLPSVSLRLSDIAARLLRRYRHTPFSSTGFQHPSKQGHVQPPATVSSRPYYQHHTLFLDPGLHIKLLINHIGLHAS